MNMIFLDGDSHLKLLPLTYTKPVSELRIGILTLREKWQKRMADASFSWKTEDYLSEKYPCNLEERNLLLNASVCADQLLVKQVLMLDAGVGLRKNGRFIAANLSGAEIEGMADELPVDKWIEYENTLSSIEYPWDIHQLNAEQISQDFELLTKGRKSQVLNSSNHLINPENIFVEEGAKVEFASINASTGPVYIGKDAEIMEGSLIRGPFALCEHSTVNMGSKIYGATTIGPHSKVGGEISQSVISGFSNKGHDGFLGHSVLGEWCNLGAGTNVSNLKNSYDLVKVWSYADQRFVKTGLQFSGLIMGDHSKAGISSMFNTGSVVGVGCNIHGAGFPRQFIPSFSDGGTGGFKTNQLKAVFATASKVMARRGKDLSQQDEKILSAVFDISAQYRRY